MDRRQYSMFRYLVAQMDDTVSAKISWLIFSFFLVLNNIMVFHSLEVLPFVSGNPLAYRSKCESACCYICIKTWDIGVTVRKQISKEVCANSIQQGERILQQYDNILETQIDRTVDRQILKNINRQIDTGGAEDFFLPGAVTFFARG